MEQVTRIIEDVKNEKKERTKFLKVLHLKFARASIDVFNYSEIVDNISGNQYYVKHNHDPEFIDIQELNQLKEGLQN